jgi:hypothetical protein
MELTKCAALWARRSHGGAGVVVALPVPLPLGVADEIRGAGLTAKEFFPMAGCIAVFLEGSPGAMARLLNAVPLPKSQGSRTAGNLLPR